MQTANVVVFLLVSDTGSLVGGVRERAPQHGPGISCSHHCYLLPSAEQHLVKSVSKADAGQLCASVSGFV